MNALYILGANIIAALSNEARFQCMAHRLSTVLNDAWKSTKEEHEQFNLFDIAVHSLVAYVNKSSGIQEHLPKTIKSPSGTRPWRTFFLVHDSILSSYEALRDILITRNEEHRVLQISPALLKEIVNFFGKFNKIFDKLEMSDKPTLQNVIPTYYLIVSDVCAEANSDSDTLRFLKRKVIAGMNEKYWSSTTEMHKIACILDPSFKALNFIRGREQLQFVKGVQRGLVQLLEQENEEETHHAVKRVHIAEEDDPFSALREAAPVQLRNPSTDTSADELKTEFQQYIEKQFPKPDNLCVFWKNSALDFPTLSSLAKKVLVIQASSGESERHFSGSGEILSEKRNRLSADSVEALTVLKEAHLNKLWPAKI